MDKLLSRRRIERDRRECKAPAPLDLLIQRDSRWPRERKANTFPRKSNRTFLKDSVHDVVFRESCLFRVRRGSRSYQEFFTNTTWYPTYSEPTAPVSDRWVYVVMFEKPRINPPDALLLRKSLWVGYPLECANHACTVQSASTATALHRYTNYIPLYGFGPTVSITSRKSSMIFGILL